MRSCLRFVVVALTAATLAACAQSAIVTDKSASLATGRTASTETRTASVATASVARSVARRRVAVAAKKHTPYATSKRPAAPQDASHGIASFYAHGSQTASGEKFDPSDLTAAHRTLPFGTRLRVTNVATGQSVTVRVNDRGPFIAGRVVDVSQSAAETLGLVGRGIAKVKLDVVE